MYNNVWTNQNARERVMPSENSTLRLFYNLISRSSPWAFFSATTFRRAWPNQSHCGLSALLYRHNYGEKSEEPETKLKRNVTKVQISLGIGDFSLYQLTFPSVRKQTQ